MSISRPIVLTARTVSWLARCTRRIWLDLYGDRTLQVADNPVAARRAAAGVVHEAAVMVTIREPAPPVDEPDWPSLVAETQALMRAGATEIRQGGMEACGGRRFRLRGRPDVMRRTPHPSLLGAWSYEPIEIKQHGMATSHDTIQLDFSRWLLTQAQGHTPDGELWLGADADGQPAMILQRSEPLAALECDLRQIAELSSDTEPAIAFARHCGYCAWRNACDAAADTRQDIALLSRLDRRTATALRTDGFTRLADIAALSPSRLMRYPYADETRAAHLHAHAQALIRGVPYDKGPPPSPLPMPALFFDIESCPHTQEPWAFGWLDAAGVPGMAIVSAWHVAAKSTHAIIADIPVIFVRDPAEGWQQVVVRAGRDAGAILHWGRYEQECLARTGGERAHAALHRRLTDLHTVLDGRYALPIARSTGQTTGSLKAVGTYLGHRWPDEADWLVAWERYTAWHEQVALNPFEGTPAVTVNPHLAPALDYLCADLEALRLIWSWLHEHESPFGSPHQG